MKITAIVLLCFSLLSFSPCFAGGFSMVTASGDSTVIDYDSFDGLLAGITSLQDALDELDDTAGDETDPVVKALNGIVSSNGSAFSALTTSAGVFGVISDEEGSGGGGVLIGNNSPTITTPTIEHINTTGDITLNVADAAGSNKVSITDSDDAEIAAVDSNGNLTCTTVTVNASETPGITARDSNCEGTDKTVGSITWNATTVTEGSKDADLSVKVWQGGDETEVLFFDESDDQWETTKGLDVGGNATITGTLGVTGAITNTANIKGNPKHLRATIIDPLAVQTEDNEICLWPVTDAALTITKVTVTLDATTNEVAGDVKYADAFIGMEHAAVINAFDTSSGVLADDSITSGAVAAGKCIYLSFDSAPNTAIKQMCIDIQYDFD